jgi:hypothetical protein
MEIVWTGYLRYRAKIREFDLPILEKIVRFGNERYFDSSTGRRVVIGRHKGSLVMIPYERDGDVMTPVTVHTTSRKQVHFRLNSGRFVHE